MKEIKESFEIFKNMANVFNVYVMEHTNHL
jgi:hypothetical protein